MYLMPYITLFNEIDITATLKVADTFGVRQQIEIASDDLLTMERAHKVNDGIRLFSSPRSI